jgi:His/Glu/Gln/Arg/opine family amino acid ABC transporter permease subunit
MYWYLQIIQYLPFLLKGLYWTVIMSLGAMAGGAIVGLVCEAGRRSRIYVVRVAVKIYIDVFRSTPPLVQLLAIYYALPVLTGHALSGVQAGLIGMSLHGGAYFAEIFRAGIASVGKGQFEAAEALGMSPVKLFSRIVFPQAIRNMLPAITNNMIVIVKETSLLSFVSVSDVLRNGQVVAMVMQRNMEPLTVVAVLYLLVTAPLAILAHILEARRQSART